jgi:hypothetical protein
MHWFMPGLFPSFVNRNGNASLLQRFKSRSSLASRCATWEPLYHSSIMATNLIAEIEGDTNASSVDMMSRLYLDCWAVPVESKHNLTLR